MFRATIPHRVKLGVLPVVSPPRHIPYGLEDGVKVALDEVCDQGVIVPIDHPTDWVNCIKTVQTHVNRQEKRCVYYKRASIYKTRAWAHFM